MLTPRLFRPRDYASAFAELLDAAIIDQILLSAVATLAYDRRRSEHFTEQLRDAEVDGSRGAIGKHARGSMYGEIGQTQFSPKAILEYGAGN